MYENVSNLITILKQVFEGLGKLKIAWEQECTRW